MLLAFCLMFTIISLIIDAYLIYRVYLLKIEDKLLTEEINRRLSSLKKNNGRRGK